MLSYPEDSALLKRVSKEFVHSKRFEFDSPTQLTTLLRVLQLVIQSLAGENERRARAIATLKRDEHRPASQHSQNTRVVVADRCPICGVGFTSVHCLDHHIAAQHTPWTKLWEALRTAADEPVDGERAVRPSRSNAASASHAGRAFYAPAPRTLPPVFFSDEEEEDESAPVLAAPPGLSAIEDVVEFSDSSSDDDTAPTAPVRHRNVRPPTIDRDRLEGLEADAAFDSSD
jgi:hypothetical protein